MSDDCPPRGIVRPALPDPKQSETGYVRLMKTATAKLEDALFRSNPDGDLLAPATVELTTDELHIALDGIAEMVRHFEARRPWAEYR
jgi:hypothetical protein